jgi:hypothetical protein
VKIDRSMFLHKLIFRIFLIELEINIDKKVKLQRKIIFFYITSIKLSNHMTATTIPLLEF